jgi:hypothetical protein
VLVEIFQIIELRHPGLLRSLRTLPSAPPQLPPAQVPDSG